MFRRKKSSTDVEQRATPPISISGPMRISAPAPHIPSSHGITTMPLYERFAKTSNENGDGAIPGRARKSMTSSRPRAAVEGEEGGMSRSEVRHERDEKMFGGAGSRAEARVVGLGTSTPSREDVTRVSTQGRHQQQVSPPTSPTFPRANGTSAATPKKLPNVTADALDDLTPPTSFLTKKMRPLPEPKAAATPKRTEQKNSQLTRTTTPPSPPPPSRPLPSVISPELAAFQTPSHAPARPPELMLPSPVPNETGALQSATNLRVSLSLGNSLEAPRGPRRARYSPLAAFGPPVSPSASAGSSYSVSSPQEAPPPPPPKPHLSSAPTPNIESSHLGDTTQNLGIDTSRPSTDSFTYSDRHASVQPLKTASVELRVGLAADDLEAFHSPLFGAGFNTQTNEKYDRNDGTAVDPHVKRLSRHRGEPSNAKFQNTFPSVLSNDRSAPSNSNADEGMEGKYDTGARMRGRSGRIAPSTIQDTAARVIAPPTPPSPPPPASKVIHDARPGRVENEPTRQRTESVSSAGSMKRKVTMYAKCTDEGVPELPVIEQPNHQTPRSLMRGQIPTPPTSVDGHGNDQNQRLTITGVLEGEQSPDVPSPPPFKNRGIRGMGSHHVIQESSSSSSSSLSPLGEKSASFRAKPVQPLGNIVISDMTSRKAVAPSLVTSSSSSSANVSSKDEVQGRPTPKLRTQDLPAQTFPPQRNHQLSQLHDTPPSPPQSPPQPVTPVLSAVPSGPRSRSKSRTRSTRPGTSSSSHSQHYVPPSSASSSDGPGRSPSALSVLNPFSSGSTGGSGHTPRKLTKTPPHSARIRTDSMGAVEQYQCQNYRAITESPEQMDSLVDADPFAKGEVVRAPTSGDSASISGASMIPPVPPFARSQSSGTSSGPPSPASPGDYVSSRAQRRGQGLDAQSREDGQALANRWDAEGTEDLKPSMSEPDANSDGQMEAEPEPESSEPTFYPLEKHLMHADLLGALLLYLTFRDWCTLTAVNDALRRQIEHRRDLREFVLEHYLHTVGYTRWRWSTKEHIMLTFRDLNSYMRGVSIPSHQYASDAKAWLDAKQQVQERPDDEYLKFKLKTASVQKSLLASSCRAYTRVVLRLRAQAEAMERDAEGDPAVYQFTPPQSTTSVNTRAHGSSQIMNHARRSMSRVRAGALSRPGSPGDSSLSHSHHGHTLNGSSNGHGHGTAKINRYERAALAGLGPRFRSPLFRLGHAPCLRVCVPNPEGAWLSDSSILECEKELKRAGVIPLLRAGDVVWDTAVGDEGNDGRVVWDGNYLIDLDYTYSRSGEVPQYLHTLAFPPSYFHRVIRTPGNPICHIDISPWGDEIAANLQLLQDRIKTETPQGGHHTVVRWIHRSRFRIRPNPYTNAAIPIPGTSLSVDPGWYGAVIIEIEGTNEGLADLQQRCKSGFPPRAVGRENGAVANGKSASNVFRLLRERSRPGEIWLRAVREKERLL